MRDGRFRWIRGLSVIGIGIWAGLSTTDSHAGRPGWIDEVPLGTCFEYFRGRDHSCESESKAERLATVDAWRQIVQNRSVQALQRMTGLTDVREDQVIFETVRREIEVTGDATRVEGFKVIERHPEKADRGCWEFYVLARIPKEGVDWRHCPEPKGYGLWGPLGRSLLVPGWGQSYKGEKKKARMFRLSEAASAGVALGSYLMVRHEEEQVAASRSRVRSSEGELWETIAWITGGLGVLIHVYNVVDAITAPGAKQYADAHSGQKTGRWPSRLEEIGVV